MTGKITKPRVKPITLKNIQKQQKKINQWTTYVLDEKTNTVLKYYEVFDNHKIEELLTEAYEKIQYAEANDIELFTDDSRFMQFIYFLLIKHFTHLGDQIPDNLEGQIQAMDSLVSTGLFEEIFNNILDSNEVLRVVERFQEFQALVIQMGNVLLDAQKELDEKVVNKEIFNTIKSPLGDMADLHTAQPIHPLVKPPISPANLKASE